MHTSMPSHETSSGYLLAQNHTEIERLSYQHEVIKDAMNGQLVLAPLDLSLRGLHILDSATADGEPPSSKLPYKSNYPRDIQ